MVISLQVVAQNMNYCGSTPMSRVGIPWSYNHSPCLTDWEPVPAKRPCGERAIGKGLPPRPFSLTSGSKPHPQTYTSKPQHCQPNTVPRAAPWTLQARTEPSPLNQLRSPRVKPTESQDPGILPFHPSVTFCLPSSVFVYLL